MQNGRKRIVTLNSRTTAAAAVLLFPYAKRKQIVVKLKSRTTAAAAVVVFLMHTYEEHAIARYRSIARRPPME